MTLLEVLNNKRDGIVLKWIEDALSIYSEEASRLYGRQKDPFANPVGHSLREGTHGIFECLVRDIGADETRPYLQEIIRIRAVQQFSPSEAVRFIFNLKRLIRTEIAERLAHPGISSELAKLEAKIDQVALVAFDVFVECREQVSELRVSEMKRNTSWLMEKLSRRDCEARGEAGVNEGVSG